METIVDTKDRLDGVSSLHKIAFLRHAALKQHVGELEAPLTTALIGGGVGDYWNPANNLSEVVSLYRCNNVSNLVGARESLRLIEGSADFQEAVRVMEPLLELIAADNAEIEERRRLEGEAYNAEREAREAAEAKHQAALAAAVAKDPKVIAAKAALAGIRRLGAPLVTEESDARELQADFK